MKTGCALLLVAAQLQGCAKQPTAAPIEPEAANHDQPAALDLEPPPVDIEPPSPAPESIEEAAVEPGPPSPAPNAVDGTAIELEPIAEVKARAIYTPDPDIKHLGQTKAALENRSGIAKIRFCVAVDGKTNDISVTEPFPDDPQVDEILIQTVARWRFKPKMVDGSPVVVCSEVTFNVRFVH
ncbi:MAG: TonB family protein [Myxococcales bacterium]|nr:TonB family protein [Myxococcales bacterium]